MYCPTFLLRATHYNVRSPYAPLHGAYGFLIVYIQFVHPVTLYSFLMHLGEFGTVYRGTLSGWRGNEQDVIAVKTLKGT